MTRTRTTGRLLAALLVASAALVGASAVGATADAQACSFPFSKVDATGTEVTIEDEPQTVVTLAPSAAQTMWEIGAKEKVVGVSKYADYLAGADERANVSGPGRSYVQVEKVVAQKPDLVLAPNVVSNETVQKLRDAGLTVYRFRAANSVESVEQKTLLTGKLVGECEGAQSTVDKMQSELSGIRETVKGEPRPDVLYVFFGYTAGEGTFIDSMIELAGGNNVADDANITGYGQVSQEVVAEQDPDWIILNSDQPTVPKTEAYNSTTAVQENNILVLTTDYLNQPAPRVVVPIRRMAMTFHPEAFEATPTPSPTSVPTTTPTATDTSTPTPAGAPGFGVAVGVLALLGSLALGTRRT